MAFDPLTDYSRTQRIVLLVDLNPLLHLQNPSPYLTSIISSAKILLHFPPLSSSSFFAFKLFFSSLSPLLSSSKIHSLAPTCPLSLSFNHPTETLDSLSNVLNSLSNLHQNPLFEISDSMPSRASFIAASVRQLLHEYAWDAVIEDLESGTISESCDWICVRSNLVVLFSLFSKSVRCLSGFLGVATNDECLGNVDLFSKKFCGIFESVNDAFVQRDIQISWIDVRYESNDKENEDDDLKLESGFFESGIRNLGWGCLSTDSIVLGSALLPFGLIYPMIGMTSSNFYSDEFQIKIQAKLHLEILDKSGKPLDCKFSDVELTDWKTLPDNFLVAPRPRKRTEGFGRRKISWELFGDGVTNLHVKGVRRCSELERFKRYLSDPILVREFSEVSTKTVQGSDGNFFADKVLEMLALEFGDTKKPKFIPLFQLLLSFFYREDYCALVSISTSNGDSHLGILKPFMVSSALLFVIDNEFYSHELGHSNEDRKLEKLDSQRGRRTGKLNVDLNQSCSSVNFKASPSIRCSQDGEGKRKEKEKTRHLSQDFTWKDFYVAAFDHLKIDFENAYFYRYCNSSKKLKFLKCWVKQIKKSPPSGLMLPEKLQCQQKVVIEEDNRLRPLQHESEELATSSALASDKEDFFPGASRPQAEAAADYHSKTSEDFFNNLSSKIQQGLESEAIDLGALAERLVSSTIFWLNQKHEVQGTTDNQPNAGKSDSSSGCMIVAELNKLLVREPKDIAAKQKNNTEACGSVSTGLASENIVREHELQIFFRMEILQSAVGSSISESMKKKFVKHICLLLEAIQCHLEGGFFGEWKLENYVRKIIKSRYCQSLEDVAHRIYEQMDLLLFADENEPLKDLLNSEDSYHSWKENSESGEVGGIYSSNDRVSAENELHENDSECPQGIQNEYTCKLIKAQERRDEARRYAHFPSWIPNLQKVWAPKLPKPKMNHPRKSSKRKYERLGNNGVACETPLTETRHIFQRGSRFSDGDTINNGDHLCGSVAKALFKDMEL